MEGTDSKKAQITVDKALSAIEAWLRIAYPPGVKPPTSEDVKKSALLRRLLSGENPLPEAPPLNNGKPWYELVDNKEAYPHIVFLSNDGTLVIEEEKWNIIEENKSGRKYVVSWPKTDLICRLEKKPLKRNKKWHLEIID